MHPTKLRTNTCGDLSAKDVEKKVVLCGWVDSLRAHGKIGFINIRDKEGVTQLFLEGENARIIPTLTNESVIRAEGKVSARPDKLINKSMKTGEIEIKVDKLEIISRAEALPIDISDQTTTELSKRLDYRFLDLHRERVQAIFKIQSEIANAFREHFYNKGFMEMQPPSVISAASEGGTELFPVQYFEQKAYLAQSPQLYKQMLACTVEKTFMITPVWRAEKHNTIRHLNESRQMDIECAFMDQMAIMKELEEVVKHIIENVLKKCKKELDFLGVKIKIPKGIYLAYEDAIKKVGGKVGEDFNPEQEKKLCDMYLGDIVFTHTWPSSIKPFYIMPKDGKKDAKSSEGFDALYGGMEISSGGQRIHIPELLIERLKAKKLNPKNFESYINSFRYGSPEHAGWSIGLERFTMTLLGLDNIREACLFPRDRDRLTP